MNPGTLAREPFRLFFPLGAFLGGAGVLPWLLFGGGLIPNWPGAYHALTMTQSFLLAVAFGFLGTMIPRRTGAAPFSGFEIALAALALVAVPLAALLGQLVAAQAAYLVVLGTLVQFALRRMLRSRRVIPPSFVLVPVGLLSGVAGAILIATNALGGPGWMFPTGRGLVGQGLFLGLVLALTPMLTPAICHNAKAEELVPRHPRLLRSIYGLVGALFLASFAVEHGMSEPGGLLMRGGVVAGALLLGGAGRLPTAPGLHRWMYWVALLLLPIGLVAAGTAPVLRVSFLHLTFIGGLSMLVFAVTIHVVLLHTGREAAASGWPWSVAAVGVLALAATVLRACAERFATHYVGVLLAASVLWLAGLVIWAAFLVPRILRPLGHER
jgi:uncharacterized protein involved in response to NO